MFLTILLILSAFGLSSIAGYYSVAGMTAIFAASWWPIVIMTGTLEFSKIVVSSWLYRNWNKTPRFLKIYFTFAVIILMFITSLGIFGYLSKAHIDQLATTSDNPLFIQQIDQQIATEQARIDDNRKIIIQMDSAVSSMLSQSTAESAQRANKGVNMAKQANALRTSQQKDRNNLNKQIDEANQKIRELNKEKLKLEQEQIKIEAEVGPIKYIAQMFYGDNPDKNLLEKAVRYMIVLIIVVFDPLAVLMFIAANMSLAQWQEDRKKPVPPPLPTDLNDSEDEPKKKDHSEFVHIDKIEIDLPNIIVEESPTDIIEAVEPGNVQIIDNVTINVTNTVDDTEIDPVTVEELETKEYEKSTDIEEVTLSDVMLLPEAVEEPVVDEPTIEELVVEEEVVEEPIIEVPVVEEKVADTVLEVESNVSLPEESETVDSLIDAHFKELPLVDNVEETVQSNNEQPLIELVDEILKLADDLVVKETPTEETVTYIDGKPIQDFLNSTQTEVTDQTEPSSDEMLQLVTIPGITKKPDDILSTIKRYHNVRLDDARRSLR